MRARVITFYAEGQQVDGLDDALRAVVPESYGSIPGFKGLLVLGQPGDRQHVIALTLWDDDYGIKASDALADNFTLQIAEAIGTSVSRSVGRRAPGQDRGTV